MLAIFFTFTGRALNLPSIILAFAYRILLGAGNLCVVFQGVKSA